jgi:hypothetical protein
VSLPSWVASLFPTTDPEPDEGRLRQQKRMIPWAAMQRPGPKSEQSRDPSPTHKGTKVIEDRQTLLPAPPRENAR